MFSELMNELRSAVNGLRPGPARKTITVAKPYCSPARDIVMTALSPYGVKVYGYTEVVKMISPRYALKNLQVKADVIESVTRFLDPLPTATVADVVVSEEAAVWAEYLLLRTGKLYRIGAYQDPRNGAWAARHGGRMPPAWEKGQPWIEKSCTAGINAWQAAKDTANQKGRKTK